MNRLTRTIASATALLLTAIAGPNIGLAQEDSDAPPRLLKGGIVHQLRSLTENAKNVIDGKLKRSPSPRATPPANESARPTRPAIPVQPTGRATLRRTHQSPWLERMENAEPSAQIPAPPTNRPAPKPTSQQVAHQPNQHRLADVITPEDMLSQRDAARNNQAAGKSRVHVESQIPEAVRNSYRQRSAAQMPASSRSTEPQQPTTPHVSRIPLPGRATAKQPPAQNQTSAPTSPKGKNPLVAKLPYSAAKPLPKLSPVPKPARKSVASTDASGAPPRVSRLAVPGKTPQIKPRTTAAIPALRLPKPSAPATSLSVSVPGPLAKTPASQRRPSAQPNTNAVVRKNLPSQRTASQHNNLPKLPGTTPINTPRTNSRQGLAATTPPLPSPKRTSPATQQSTSSIKLPPPRPTPAKMVSSAKRTGVSLPPPQLQSNSQSRTALPSAQRIQQRSARAPSSNSSAPRMRMVTPRIVVTLNGPSDIPVSAPARYEVVVKNEDKINLSGIVLQMDIPAGIGVKALKPSQGQFDVEKASDGSTLLSWSFENLPGSKTAIAPLELVAGSAKNFAVAMEWTLVPLAELARINVLAPRLELALDGPSEVKFGQPNVYRLHVRNPGNAPATGVAVTLTAEQYGSSSSVIGDIPAGSEETIDVELTFNQKGNIDISAAATAEGDLTSNTAIGVLVRQPDLVAELASPGLVYHGTATEMQIKVSNRGDADAEDIAATLQLPPGSRLATLPPGAQLTGDEVTWNLVNLAAGEAKMLNLQLEMTNPGENAIRFRVADNTGNTASAAAITHVEAIADLTLLVSDPVAPAPIGSEVVYELLLTNRGSKAAQKVSVIAQFSEGIEPLRADGPEYRVIPGQLFFEPIETIAAGESINLRVYAKASAGGMHRFRAEVRTEDTDMRLVQEESTRYMDNTHRIAAPISGSVIR